MLTNGTAYFCFSSGLLLHGLHCGSLLPQLLPDIERFMEALTQKMVSIYDMISKLEEPDNPPPKERFTLNLHL